jgi:hypothetical protein
MDDILGVAGASGSVALMFGQAAEAMHVADRALEVGGIVGLLLVGLVAFSCFGLWWTATGLARSQAARITAQEQALQRVEEREQQCRQDMLALQREFVELRTRCQGCAAGQNPEQGARPRQR